MPEDPQSGPQEPRVAKAAVEDSPGHFGTGPVGPRPFSDGEPSQGDQGLWEFGEYTVLEEIGRGGMGVVFLARHKRLKREVALKMLRAGPLASESDRARFRREATAAAQVRDSGIVQVYESGEILGQSYYSMEFINGRDLRELVREGPLDPRAAARYLVEVARAVQHLHDTGILHRDLKPANILIDEDDHAKVTDFGVARRYLGTTHDTYTEAIMGSPNYLSPEQASGRGDLMGRWTDIHGLGAILYCSLTGSPPFDGDTLMDTILDAIRGEPPLPRRLRPEIPRALEAICLKCLEKNPSRRYVSAEAMAEDLERFLDGKPVQADVAGFGYWARHLIQRERLFVLHLFALSAVAVSQLTHYLFEGDPNDLFISILMAPWLLICLFMTLWDRIGVSQRTTETSWGIVDALFLTVIFLVVDGVKNPGVTCYALAIASAGLTHRHKPVIASTLAAMVGYGILILDSLYWHPSRATVADGMFIVEFVFLGLGIVAAYQVYRTRLLTRVGEPSKQM